MVEPIGIASVASAILGFDTATPLSPSQARSLRASGFGFCARYLKRTPSEQPPASGPALTLDEAHGVLGSGLALIPVQYGSSTLVPDASGGTAVGEAAAINAAALGIPVGVTIWCDLEWAPDVAADPSSTIAYANAWHDAVVAAGFRAGLYVGPNLPLGGVQLGELAFRSYWKSASGVPWPVPRGFQLLQGDAIAIAGTTVDPDVACDDAQGDRLVWWMPSEGDA
ncbi:MAG: DUF1906 domain-containing protein [Nannocystaceae bacterium]|nr:DUF1906 domain-containing protein [Nannocystaceae bacterium]